MIYERHTIPRVERRMFELERENEELRRELEQTHTSLIALQRVVDRLRQQIKEQEIENDVLVRTNQYLEYHVTDYF